MATEQTPDDTERILNPEAYIDAEDYLDLIYEQDAAIHFHLENDTEWWLAHDQPEQPDEVLEKPWLFNIQVPDLGRTQGSCTDRFARHLLNTLWYGRAGDRKHRIHQVRHVHISDAPQPIQTAVGWDDRPVDAETNSGGGRDGD